MLRFLMPIAIALTALLSACGTVTPMTSPGGGKRFAIEQVLVSAVMKKAITDFPTAALQGAKVSLNVTVVHDEGGGSFNGGRPYLSETLNNVYSGTNAGGSNGVGFAAARDGGGNYIKDMAMNNSDAKQFNALLVSHLSRQNLLVNPDLPADRKVDYAIEVFVDVLGTVRSRTDWLVNNKETLKSVISLEYVITPINSDTPMKKRVSGSIAYEASYEESYIAWMGPSDTRFELHPSEMARLIPNLGPGVDTFDNVRKEKKEASSHPAPEGAGTAVQILQVH